MIFGFNTDIKFGSTVYHIQSEARKTENLLETQVFVKGRCLGKRATSYTDSVNQPDFSEEKMHEMLKAQHRYFVEAARNGSIEEEIGKPGVATGAISAAANATATVPVTVELPAASAPTSGPAMDISEAPPIPLEVQPQPETKLPAVTWTMEPAGSTMGRGMSIESLAPVPTADGTELLICIKVADESDPAAGAQLTCRVVSGGLPPSYVYAQTGPGGVADVRLSLQDLKLGNSTILVQASHREKSVSRKFLLKHA